MAKTCEGVLSDLRAVSDFVRAQAALGVDTSALGQAQVSAMTTRLRVLQGISVQQATQLTEAVNEGPWTPAQKSGDTFSTGRDGQEQEGRRTKRSRTKVQS